jgi:adenosylhomocysteinase
MREDYTAAGDKSVEGVLADNGKEQNITERLDTMKSIIKDINLAASGTQKIEWVKKNMPVMSALEQEFSKTRPFEGVKMTISIHLEAKTAYLAKVLTAGGADVAVTGCNPLSTQDDVASALAKDNLTVFGWYGATNEEYLHHIESALCHGPNIIVDDGGDLINMLHTKRTDLIPGIWGGAEETTTGVMRLEAMQREGILKFPMIAVNNAFSKHLFDNRYGTGQSVWDGINRTTNLMVAGKYVVVAGYGWCGKGIALRAKGLGAKVIICEFEPIKALEAAMDGYEVMPMEEAAAKGDMFITATGCDNIVRGEHFIKMKDGVILANAGHFDCEIVIPELEALAVSKTEGRKNITSYRMADGRVLNLLGEGRLVNLACGDGHPAEIMDLSFAIQSLSAKYLVENRNIPSEVINVPIEIDNLVAQMKLDAMGIKTDKLTDEQKKYMEGWKN